MTNVSEIIWKDVPDFEGYYQVSNSGLIRRYGKVNALKPSVIRYSRVTLCVNGTFYYFQVHRVVATVFVPNPFNLPMVNHKDTDKQNNNATNLEWTDHDGNMKHGVDNLVFPRGEKRHNSVISDADVHFIRTELTHLKTHQIAKMYNINYYTMWDIIKQRKRS